MALFGLRRTPRPAEADRQRIAAWAREAGGLSDDVVVKVNEIVCMDPACRGTETVILVMSPGHAAYARKIPGPLGAVTREAVAAVMEASA